MPTVAGTGWSRREHVLPCKEVSTVTRNVRWAAACVALLAAAAMPGCSTASDDYQSTTAATSTAEPTQTFASRLAATDAPLDIYLVGDGTGASLGGWVYLTIQSLAQTSGRPADIREWDVLAGEGYIEPAIHVADGTGQPITLWNASVSRNIDFINDVLPQMRPPAGIDLVLVNNGLDIGPTMLAQESIPLMRVLRDQNPGASVVSILQPAPSQPEAQSDQQRANTRDLEISSRKNEFQTIDVATALSEAPDVYDGVDRYANTEGQRIWASVVADSLTSDITVPSQ
ncbi:hypothetical protein CH263_24500 [Rhodococcus sp. 06-1059B-a]|nr:hypothetical protein CH263_24500 [Rhodococcus sp. 06-1059B-a]